jgi:lysophospholipase L1-like esterase
MQVEQGNSVTAYEVYYTKFKYQNNAYIETNPLYGKKIVGFGDSIMYGVGNSNIGIPQLLAARNGMTAVNSAIAGATILDVNNSKHVPLQITNSTDTDADYIIINGGVNDVQIEDINTKYGTLSEYYGGGISDTTFVGALELMLKAAKVKWLGKKIVYILVHDMSTRDKTKLDTIVDLTKQACNKWSIPILNLYEEGGLNTRLNDMIAPYTGNSDGTHPNEAGYLTFYIPQLEKKLRSL